MVQFGKWNVGRWRREEWRVGNLRLGWRRGERVGKGGWGWGMGAGQREHDEGGWCKWKWGLETVVHFQTWTPNPVPRERRDERRGEKVWTWVSAVDKIIEDWLYVFFDCVEIELWFSCRQLSTFSTTWYLLISPQLAFLLMSLVQWIECLKLMTILQYSAVLCFNTL